MQSFKENRNCRIMDSNTKVQSKQPRLCATKQCCLHIYQVNRGHTERILSLSLWDPSNKVGVMAAQFPMEIRNDIHEVENILGLYDTQPKFAQG